MKEKMLGIYTIFKQVVVFGLPMVAESSGSNVSFVNLSNKL